MRKFYFGIIGLALLGCVEKTPQENNESGSNNEEQAAVADDRISEIPIFQVVFDSSKMTSPVVLQEILLDLENSFEKYTFKSTSNEQKEKIENIEAQRFQETLSADFDNDLFKSMGAIDFVCVSPKEKEFNSIQIEQWRFESETIADSCFESLTHFQEKEIHFMTVNWIWLKQKNNLFLISSLNNNVLSDDMQKVKGILAHELEKNGVYRSVSFFE